MNNEDFVNKSRFDHNLSITKLVESLPCFFSYISLFELTTFRNPEMSTDRRNPLTLAWGSENYIIELLKKKLNSNKIKFKRKTGERKERKKKEGR